METDLAVRHLDDQECWDRVAAASHGRLALSVVGHVDILPIQAVLSNGDLYFRAEPGANLDELAAGPRVAYDVEGADDDTAYCVVVTGVTERLDRQADIDAAERLPAAELSSVTSQWVRIRPSAVSGRAYRRVPVAAGS
jgi:nitroimidazol reductase NimA-like FMN-containing flavoprotein (pyridoxamine 5'-phosphate oxidase superfamily)